MKSTLTNKKKYKNNNHEKCGTSEIVDNEGDKSEGPFKSMKLVFPYNPAANPQLNPYQVFSK